MHAALFNDVAANAIVAIFAAITTMAVSRILQMRTGWQLARLFGSAKTNNVQILVGIWYAAQSPDGQYRMDKQSPSAGREPVPFIGVPELVARADVSASTAIAEALSRVPGISANAAFDIGDMDLSRATVIVGTAISNEATKDLLAALAASDQKRIPLTMQCNRSAPEETIFTVTRSGVHYKSDENLEYAAIVRYANPFSKDKKGKIIVVSGQFANGTRVAAEFFGDNWKLMFSPRRNGVIISTPKERHGPVKIETFL